MKIPKYKYHYRVTVLGWIDCNAKTLETAKKRMRKEQRKAQKVFGGNYPNGAIYCNGKNVYNCFGGVNLPVISY
jgi:hypothetical protein